MSISTTVLNPTHGKSTEFDVSIVIVETWKGPRVSEVHGSMTDLYNDPSIEGRNVTSCGAPISLGFVVVLTNDTRPVFATCDHNAWMIDEIEIDDMREYVTTKLEGGVDDT